MTLVAGSRLGPYEIHSPLGAAGMGEVYRARDARLGRALKVLPSGFATDPERLHRFEQEARAAAALNHPNILAVHDIGAFDGVPYIVSELLDGATLRERLAGGPLPVRKATEYAVQVAHGLAAAHEKGIVYRDLKPENVFVTTDGHVKILDFGIAKLTEAEPAFASVTVLPTTPPHTIAGVVLGTVGYMSPEQVRGLTADHCSDIFAFGAVLYEMLSGHRAFRGETTMDTMMAIAKEDPPDLPAAQRHLPPALERLIDRCLEKNPAARFQSTRDLAFALEGLSTRSDSAAVVTIPARRSRERWRWIIAAAAAVTSVVTLAFAALGFFSPTRAVAPEMRLQIVTPSGSDPISFAVSPDGRKIVFPATSNERSQLWLRGLASEEAELLAGTDGVAINGQAAPFWSPDGESIGFFTRTELKRIDLTSGVVRTLASAPGSRGGSWNADGTILFGPATIGPLYRIAAMGGAVAEVTRVNPPQQTSHRFPQRVIDAERGAPTRLTSNDGADFHPIWSPDGKHVVFSSDRDGGLDDLYERSIDGSTPETLLLATSQYKAANHWSPDGRFILFVTQGQETGADLWVLPRSKTVSDCPNSIP